MPQIDFVQPDGSRVTVSVPAGVTIMQAATENGIHGIVAECGGNAMCATCHVYVDPEGAGGLPPMSADEDALLDGTTSAREPHSRLGCQVKVTDALDGLTVHMPARQT